MIQAIDLMDGKTRYRNHFVRTPKYLREQAAGRFLFPTWTTLAPRLWENIPGTPPFSQAGVIPFPLSNYESEQAILGYWTRRSDES